MTQYNEIKAMLSKATDLNAVNQVLETTVQHRDQLDEVIELALEKQTALSSSPNNEKW